MRADESHKRGLIGIACYVALPCIMPYSLVLNSLWMEVVEPPKKMPHSVVRTPVHAPAGTSKKRKTIPIVLSDDSDSDHEETADEEIQRIEQENENIANRAQGKRSSRTCRQRGRSELDSCSPPMKVRRRNGMMLLKRVLQADSAEIEINHREWIR